jgi:hypothetical protein
MKIIKKSNLPTSDPFLVTMLLPIFFEHYNAKTWEIVITLIVVGLWWLKYIYEVFFAKQVNVIKKVKQKESESKTVD